jgi:hypothetical protein
VEVNDRRFTIAGINTTAKTFQLSGVDSTAYSTYTSGGNISWRTGPCLYLSRASELKLNDLYTASDGSPHTIIGNPDSFGCEGLEIYKHGEGIAVPASIRFEPGVTNDLSMKHFRYKESASQVTSNEFQIATGGTKVVFNSPEIVIQRYNTLPSGKLFDHPELVEIHGRARIELPDGTYMNDKSEFAYYERAHFVRRNWPRQVESVGDEDTSGFIKVDDHFVGPALNTSKWISLVGTDADISIVQPGTTARGVVAVNCGNDAGGTMALNGAQISSALCWQLNRGATSVEFWTNHSSTTQFAVFRGFTDQVAALQIPATLDASSVVVPNTANFVGVIYDSLAGGNMRFISRTNSGTSQNVDTGIAPNTDTSAYVRWRIVCDLVGSAKLWYKASATDPWVQVGSLTSAIAQTVLLAGVAAQFGRSTSLRIMRYDYMEISGSAPG